MTFELWCVAHSLFWRLAIDDRARWIVISWALWAAHNKLVFEGSLTPPAKVMEIGNNLWADYDKAYARLSTVSI